ncbi:MAG: hypothetical protein ACNA7W_20620 [Pseudomonadales bacterium]
MPNRSLIASDQPLTDQQRAALRRLAGLMIPASLDYGAPGADDEAIFADILKTLAPQSELVRQAVDELNAVAGGDFAELDPAAQSAASERFRTSGSPLVGLLVALVTQCYYRDDRVMRSLEMEPRPPFPLGFELEDGDWSLLDPVRARGKRYRDAP